MGHMVWQLKPSSCLRGHASRERYQALSSFCPAAYVCRRSIYTYASVPSDSRYPHHVLMQPLRPALKLQAALLTRGHHEGSWPITFAFAYMCRTLSPPYPVLDVVACSQSCQVHARCSQQSTISQMRLDIAEGPTLTRQSAEGVATITRQESRLMMSRDQLGRATVQLNNCSGQMLWPRDHGLSTTWFSAGRWPNPLLIQREPGKNNDNRPMLGSSADCENRRFGRPRGEKRKRGEHLKR
jgi:hypothetical protein